MQAIDSKLSIQFLSHAVIGTTLLSFVWGCSPATSNSQTDAGSTNTGGAPMDAGRTGTGGATATGGAPGSGGSNPSGGAPGSGGSSASGGAPGTGGAGTGGKSTGAGGSTPGSGGAPRTGGALGSTGGNAAGGSGSAGMGGGGDSSQSTIVPDPSWTCGMPDGIPAPTKGTLVFHATMQIGMNRDAGLTSGNVGLSTSRAARQRARDFRQRYSPAVSISS